jgi:hypothetical protein
MARAAHDHAVEDAPLDVGQGDAEERLQTADAQGHRRQLLFRALRLHQRDQLARDEREGDEDGSEDHARRGVDDAHIVLAQERTDQTARPGVDDCRATPGDVCAHGQLVSHAATFATTSRAELSVLPMSPIAPWETLAVPSGFGRASRFPASVGTPTRLPHEGRRSDEEEP